MSKHFFLTSVMAGLMALASHAAVAQNVAIVNGKAVPKSRVDSLAQQIAKSGRPVTPEMETQLREEVIAREDPPYSRIERRYLFGLIRLPSGLWQWLPDVDKAGNRDQGTSGYR